MIIHYLAKIGIILFSVILFPPLFFTIATIFNYPPMLFLLLGCGLSLVAIMLALRYDVLAKQYLVVLTLLTFIFSAYLVFSQIGIDILSYQTITIQHQYVLLSILIIIALFIYFLLLGERIKYNFVIILSLFLAAMLTVLMLVVVANLDVSWLTDKLLKRGIIPPITLLLFNWGVLLLLVSIMSKQHSVDRSYLLPEYINYALPILGFIGTVLGISLSAQGIADIIASPEGISALNQDLSVALNPLSIAFDTTLIALCLSLIYTLLLMLVKIYATPRKK